MFGLFKKNGKLYLMELLRKETKIQKEITALNTIRIHQAKSMN